MPSLTCFLYGQIDPAIEGVLDEPGFRQVLEACLHHGRFTQGEGEGAGLVGRAQACGLLERTDDGAFRPGPRLVIMSAAMERAFHAVVAPLVEAELGIVAETVPLLQEAYGACSTAARFGWPEVCHTVVAAMLLDLAVGVELHLAEDVGRTSGPGVVWAFERLTAQNGFGVRMTTAPDGRAAFSQMWHVRVKRAPLGVAPGMVELLARHARGEEVALGGREGLYLKFMKLLRGSEITIPVFLPEDTEQLLAPLREGASRIVRDVVLPAFERVKQEQPLWRELDRSESYRHSAMRLLLEYAIDRVVEAGVIPAFPEGEGVPLAWGTWLWIEPPDRPAQLIPTGFEAASGAP